MSEPSVAPVGRFSPSPGLFIDRTEKSVVISGRMEVSGAEASAARAGSIQSYINSVWTQGFTDGYSVTCKIAVVYRGPGSKAGGVTQIDAVKIAGPSHVSPGLFGRSMTLNANETDAFTWTPAHEFGHVLGLQDRYSEGILSKVKGTWGGTRSTSVQVGYEGNLMAVSGGTLGSKNVADLASENQPSPYWINDDDQVAAWVRTHPLVDIARLSSRNKLRAIQTVLGGRVSGDDMAAITKICSSVTTKSEADAIRAGVNPIDLTDFGQRTTLRVVFAKMP